MSDLLTLEDIAERTHLTVGALHALRYRGRGPKAIKVGRRLLFRPEDVEAWLDEHREQ